MKDGPWICDNHLFCCRTKLQVAYNMASCHIGRGARKRFTSRTYEFRLRERMARRCAVARNHSSRHFGMEEMQVGSEQNQVFLTFVADMELCN